MNKARKIAIAGATGMVGQSFLKLLEKDYFQDSELSLLASSNSAGKEINFRGKNYKVEDLSKFNFSESDLALFSAGSSVASTYAPIAVSQGCVVVDNSSCFRYEDDIPLIVPEVNSKVLDNYELPGIIANPNCSTIQMLVALKPLHDKYTLSSMTPVAYQAVSGSGSEAIKSLEKETLLGDKLEANYQQAYYSNPIARNVIPLAGSLTDNGYSDEEMKFVHESRKILSIPDLVVEPSNARVGVRTGHGTFCSAVFENEVDLKECTDLLNNFEGVEVWNESLPTPIDVEGKDEVLVSRLRQGLSSKNILNFWVVSDNLLKGAALNAVQIAKFMEKL